MKFKILSQGHSAEIQNVLFVLGYRWNYGKDKVQHTNMQYLYAHDDGAIRHGSDEEYFNDYPYEEYILVAGGILPKAFDTETHPAIMNNLGITSFRPRKVATIERMQEIVAAMNNCLTHQIAISEECMSELVELNTYLHETTSH
jgi:hypothetical protein